MKFLSIENFVIYGNIISLFNIPKHAMKYCGGDSFGTEQNYESSSYIVYKQRFLPHKGVK